MVWSVSLFHSGVQVIVLNTTIYVNPEFKIRQFTELNKKRRVVLYYSYLKLCVVETFPF